MGSWSTPGAVPGQSRRERLQGLYLSCSLGSGQFPQNGRGSPRGTQTLNSAAAGTGQARGQDEVCHHGDRAPPGARRGQLQRPRRQDAEQIAGPELLLVSPAKTRESPRPSSLLQTAQKLPSSSTFQQAGSQTGKQEVGASSKIIQRDILTNRPSLAKAAERKGGERERERSVEGQGTGPEASETRTSSAGTLPARPSRWRLPDSLTIQLGNPKGLSRRSEGDPPPCASVTPGGTAWRTTQARPGQPVTVASTHPTTTHGAQRNLTAERHHFGFHFSLKTPLILDPKGAVIRYLEALRPHFRG